MCCEDETLELPAQITATMGAPTTQRKLAFGLRKQALGSNSFDSVPHRLHPISVSRHHTTNGVPPAQLMFRHAPDRKSHQPTLLHLVFSPYVSTIKVYALANTARQPAAAMRCVAVDSCRFDARSSTTTLAAHSMSAAHQQQAACSSVAPLLVQWSCTTPPPTTTPMAAATQVCTQYTAHCDTLNSTY